jgi:hypothetical protein
VDLAPVAASFSSDNFDDRIRKRMSELARVPAPTSAKAVGLSVHAPGA